MVKAPHVSGGKALDWESRYIDLFKFDQLSADYPHGVVPALLHNGEPILESTFINEYIDDAFVGRH